jgi:large subunit ribosomal protein L25
MKFEIGAQKRAAQGTGPSRRLRRSGRVPGILYGGDRPALNIELDHKELHQNLANEKFHASILTLSLDGAKEQVLLRAFNMHPWQGRVQHVDFQRVSRDKKIHMKVPLHFVNADKSPGMKEQGGLPNHILNELDIRCLPDDLPEFIEVDLGSLSVGDAIHVKDLALPKGVEPVLHKGENPAVATMIVPTLVTEEEEAAAAEAVPAAGEVPTTEQAAPEAAAEGAAKAGEKGAEKGADKGAAKPAEKAADKGTAEKGEKKEKK